MSKALNILAKGISALCYPLWMPTYGMLLFCISLSQTMPLPVMYWLAIVGSTFFLTALLPLLLILYQIRRGDISDIYIEKKEERTLAYVETLAGFACWWYLMTFIFHAPSWLCGTILGSTIATAIVATINYWWKISAHMTGIGGLIGGIVVALFILQPTSYYLFYIALAVAWLVMLARLYLNAHTPWQVIAGFALGLTCTLLTVLIYVYVCL